MTEKERAANATPQESRGKGKRYYTPLKEIRSLFLSGGTYTARELNHLTGSNDARKCISVLRHDEDMNIVDVRGAHGCKSYWLDTPGILNESKPIGQIIEEMAEMPIIDLQSGEINILALRERRLK